MEKELNAALGFKKVLQKFLWDAAARQLQCTQTVFTKTKDSIVEVICMLSRKARNKLIHALNGNTV